MRKAATALAVLGGVTALVAHIPMGWVAPLAMPDPLAAQMEFYGTVWDGGASDVPIFGTAQLDVSPLSRGADIRAGNGRNFLSGYISSGLARDFTMTLNIGDLPLTDARLSDLRGRVEAQMAEARYGRDGCTEMVGSVTTDVLQRNGGRIDWTGPVLTGPLRCEDGAIIADLSGRDAGQVITALIRLSPDNSYRADISVQTNRAEADAVLPLFGFAREGRVFKLTEQGKWR